jgi:hypothetical protein
MPASYQIDVAHKLVIIKATGVVSAAEMLAHNARLYNDPLFQQDYWQLVDFSETTDFQATTREIRQLADDNPWSAGIRCAFVVPLPFQYGLAHMFKVFTEDQGADLRLFDTFAEASKWLGLEP